MKENAWKELWGKRSANIEKYMGSEKELFLELKRGNGFDVVGEGLTYEAFLGQYKQIRKGLFPNLTHDAVGWSVYEVGCGSGANLYLFEKDGARCGGCDYSPNLIETAKKVLHSSDVICAEAIQMTVEPQYDAVFSNGVFSYFIDEEYASEVLERMYQKARCSIGIMDIHNIEKEEEFNAYRRQIIKDYEERYRNLPKLFYSRAFFRSFAERHNMDIVFTNSDMEGYWNNEFVFNCFMYKGDKGK